MVDVRRLHARAYYEGRVDAVTATHEHVGVAPAEEARVGGGHRAGGVLEVHGLELTCLARHRMNTGLYVNVDLHHPLTAQLFRDGTDGGFGARLHSLAVGVAVIVRGLQRAPERVTVQGMNVQIRADRQYTIDHFREQVHIVNTNVRVTIQVTARIHIVYGCTRHLAVVEEINQYDNVVRAGQTISIKIGHSARL